MNSLDGIRVLDLSRVLAGPWCTQNLGDLGADVLKVERPGAGDDTRTWGPPYLKDPQGADTAEAAYYLGANRNKRSITCDIAKPRGQALIRDLVRHCDVFIENFKVGDMARYGLDADSLLALNPKLVYCSITGFGQNGPYRARAGYDYAIQGMGGLMSVTGERDDLGGGPQKVGVAVADLFTGMYATVAILAALRHAERTGQGETGLTIHLENDSELSVLGRAFNRMSERLARQIEQIDRETAQLKAILDSMVEGVIALDANERLLFVNERAMNAMLAVWQAMSPKAPVPKSHQPRQLKGW